LRQGEEWSRNASESAPQLRLVLGYVYL